MVKAGRNLETFIVHDFQWTATARHADIVLPVAMKKVIEPVLRITEQCRCAATGPQM